MVVDFRNNCGGSILSYEDNARIFNYRKNNSLDNCTSNAKNNITIDKETQKKFDEAIASLNKCKPKLRKIIKEQQKTINKNTKVKPTKTLNNNENVHPFKKFTDYIWTMKNVRFEDKIAMTDAVNTVMDSQESKPSASTTVGMFINQAKFELDFICNNKVKDNYKDGFKQLTNDYKNYLYDRYENQLKSSAKSVYNLRKKLHESNPNVMFDSLENKSHIFYRTYDTYSNLYSSIENSTLSNAKSNLNKVYDNFITNRKDYTERSDKGLDDMISQDVKNLKIEWNSMINSLGKDFNDLKFVTKVDCLL